MSSWARFWSVDLHVHTPGSGDVRVDDYGDAETIVAAALHAGLDAIAITDHNTAAWCREMAEAAAKTDLVILPGFELSTSDGHLLGIWEEGTPDTHLEDVLVRLGIKRSQFGDPAALASEGMGACAAEIVSSGGIPIAAHIDKERGILRLPVQTHVNHLLVEPAIAAFEYVLSETPEKVRGKISGTDMVTLVQGSDTYSASLSRHALSGIGQRRTWIKAGRPDLIGLRYAFQDPDVRVRVEIDPTDQQDHPAITHVSITGGFLAGLSLDLCPDMNCFLGGTGAGKSLLLEAIRFVLDQQVDERLFPTIRSEVNRRLDKALREGSLVTVEFVAGGATYRATRAQSSAPAPPAIEQFLDGEWIAIRAHAPDLLPIASFSQGEILEFARAPVGRVALVDARLNLGDTEARIEKAVDALRQNADGLIAARERTDDLQLRAAGIDGLSERVRELSAIFEGEMVKSQSAWAKEQAAISRFSKSLDTIQPVRRPEFPIPNASLPEHADMMREIGEAIASYEEKVQRSQKELDLALVQLKSSVNATKDNFDAQFAAFKAALDEELAEHGSSSLPVLRQELESAQESLAEAESAADELVNDAEPALKNLWSARETLLAELKGARDDRRSMRRKQAQVLNEKTKGLVKIDIPDGGDVSEYREAIERLKVGSHVREPVVDTIAQRIHPFRLGRALWSGDVTHLGHLPDGVQTVDIARIVANVADRKLLREALNCQLVDTPDTLTIRFRKPEAADYSKIEDLSHGQKCTAILVLLLADGDTPVVVDQPEDALHAPWIEEYLVERLRALRGSRQYVFATHSPGLVVSADSEQLITMRADAGSGQVEACGALERTELNALALRHLEGGKVPFTRRAKKLQPSIAP